MAYFEYSHDQRIFYRIIEGVKGRPYLVFLHEGLGSVAMWKNFPERLCRATGCPGLVYDRLGFGQSSPMPQKTTIHYLHTNGLVELFALRQAVIPETPFLLVGHSDGASIALIHAAERPARLKGIIAEAPHVMVEPVTIEGIRDTVKKYNSKGKLHKAMSKYHEDKAESVFSAWHRLWLSVDFRHWNIEYLLPSIRCACLIVQGRDDPYGTEAHARRIAGKLSGPTRLEMIENCGHVPHHEATAGVLSLMADFVEKYACLDS